ncbi:hypothetical protein [Bradyrhizobium sp. CCBAU 45389]|uniref:hypothetical protein n=2 Tax=Bradyrhizobium TaxID=374 RepID=UPI0023066A10|nr:hypothetical protein [Bradyrhizobium sp. CCBAU 45389]MBR0711739.1 hypothetical protein [Bradyrhizobium liaoningense]MDA9398080.1 hypothetical protein [Bradyrhizobium sp. CCBAU 45389]
MAVMDRHILFKCPQTGMNVQHRLDDAPADRTHVSVACPACTRLHLIDRSTGRLLGDRRS